jgi:exopolyphosphatase/guanosine-5'-triphosphate,3'-diphosphate pyrophosphatase
VRVAGQGVREGLAYSLFHSRLPDIERVRAQSVESLASRFSTWNERTAKRRRSVAVQLANGLAPRLSAEVRGALDYAAHLLDLGRSMDFFDRYQHVAEMVVATELNGFTHREIALIAAIVFAAREEGPGPKAWSPLLRDQDRDAVARAGLLLALADDIEERCPPRAAIRLRVKKSRRTASVGVKAMIAWRPRGLAARFERVFRLRLLVQPG